jgi:hypothetical protein
MALERRAAVQRFREFAKAGAGLADRIDIPGAVKIMEVVPLELKVRDGLRDIGHRQELLLKGFYRSCPSFGLGYHSPMKLPTTRQKELCPATLRRQKAVLRTLTPAGAPRCRAEIGCCAITYPPIYQSSEHSRVGKLAPCVRI